MKRIVVKIGSALLTAETGELCPKRVERYATLVAELQQAVGEVILVSSGAVAAGFKRLGYTEKPTALSARQACAAVGQGLLIETYTRTFKARKRVAAQVLLSRRDFMLRCNYNNALGTLELLLEKGVVPIVNENDTVATEELTFGENDLLAALVAALVHADELLILTRSAGLYTADPNQDPAAEHLSRVAKITPEILALAQVSKSKTGSGGMAAKLRAAQLALSMGINVFIGTAGAAADDELVPDELIQIAAGKGQGTYFGGDGTPLKRKKQWIAFHSEIKGQIFIDPGAQRALLREGRSLLPVGVKRLVGTFAPGEVVEVLTLSGDFLGKGVVNYSSLELQQVLGLGAAEARRKVAPGREEVIHRNDWVCFLEA